MRFHESEAYLHGEVSVSASYNTYCPRTRKNRAVEVRGTVNTSVVNVPKDTHCVADSEGALSNSKGGLPPVQLRATLVPLCWMFMWMASCTVMTTASYAGV